MLLPFGLERRRWAHRRPDRVLWAIWTLAALFVLYLTYSRGAWLAALAAVGVYEALALYRAGRLSLNVFRVKWQSPRTRAALAFAAVVIVLLGVIALSAFGTPRRETSSRLAFYDIAWRSFRDHPLTGTGPFTFGLTLLEHRSIPPDQPHAHAHNLILNVAAELGLPGLIALGVTVALIIRLGYRRLQHTTDPAAWAHTAACGAALTAFGVHQVVDMPSMFPAVFVLMLGILAAGIVPDSESLTSVRNLHKLYPTGVSLLWGILLITGWWSARNYVQYLRGERWLIDDDTRRGAVALRQAAEVQPLPLYQAEYGYACGLLVAEGDKSFLQAGIDAYRRALDAEPPHADWWANLAVLYWQMGDQEAALTSLIQAVHYAPDSPDLWFNLGFYHEMAGQPDRARAAYQRTLDLSPVWANTHTWIASELRREMLAGNSAPPTLYTQAVTLWQDGQQAEAVSVLKATIDRDPTEPGPYARLARLFVQGGDFDQARDYLDAAEVLAQNRMDRAWIDVVKSDLAAAQGDQAQADLYWKSAQEQIWPDETGSPLPYGSDIAYYQFLRLRIPGTLLPSLIVLSPDPELIDLLR
jgi:tetratricopeptide (TPR) repeat protein